MSSESDRLLIQQIRQGDARAWEGLIERYEGRLLAFVDRRLHDRAASEDVVQETFVGFLNSLPNFDEHRGLQTYLFTIASHKLTDHLRRMGRHPLRSLSDGSGDALQQHRRVAEHRVDVADEPQPARELPRLDVRRVHPLGLALSVREVDHDCAPRYPRARRPRRRFAIHRPRRALGSEQIG